MKKLLSINMNRKIAKGIGVFNLLSGVTCPGATPICQATCYARKAERIWKSARKSREVNLEASKQPDFVTKIRPA